MVMFALLICFPAGAAGSGQVFTETVDLNHVSWMMVAIILFTLVFEYVTEWLEDRLDHSPTYLDMLHKVYAELMILGFIAFVLTIVIELGVDIPHYQLLAFEWAHLMIFAVAILYVLNAVLASYSMEAARLLWYRASMQKVEQTIADLESRRSYIEGTFHRFLSRFPLVGTRWRYSVDFKLIRLVFLHAYEMPQSFDYMSFVKAHLHKNIRHCVHIGVRTWLLVATLAATVSVGVWSYRLSGLDVREQEHYDFVDYCGLHANTSDCLGVDAAASHRRLGGSEESANCTHSDEYYACENHGTAIAAAYSNLVVGWGLFITQIFIAVRLERVWRKCFDIKGIANGCDVTAVQDALRTWAEKVKDLGVLTKDHYETRQREKIGTQSLVREIEELAHVYPASSEQFDQLVTQFLQLSNCFYVAIWYLHTRKVTHLYLDAPYLWDFFLILPSFLLVYWLVPLTARLQALLGAMLRQDVELVAEVFAFMEEVVAVRGRIRLVLLEHAVAEQQVLDKFTKETSAEVMETSQGGESPEVLFDKLDEDHSGSLSYDEVRHGLAMGESVQTKTTNAAVLLFDRFDEDQSGRLSYAEVRRGLASMSVHVTKSEFLHLVRVVDPDLSGDLEKQEWIDFMSMTDEELTMRQISENSEGSRDVAPTAFGVLHSIANPQALPAVLTRPKQSDDKLARQKHQKNRPGRVNNPVGGEDDTDAE